MTNLNEKYLDEQNLNNCGKLGNLIVLPVVKTSPLSGESYITDHGYILGGHPCEKSCFKEVEILSFRPLGWSHICPDCGNYMIFDYCADYSKLVGGKGRALKDVQKFIQLHYFCRGKAGTHQKNPLLQEPR